MELKNNNFKTIWCTVLSLQNCITIDAFNNFPPVFPFIFNNFVFFGVFFFFFFFFGGGGLSISFNSSS